MGHVNKQQGFTLIEMLTVMFIMIVMLSIAVTGFNDIRRAKGIRGGVMNLKSGLVSARQKAITQKMPTSFSFDNQTMPDRGYYVLTNASGNVSNTNYLPKGVSFDITALDEIIFDVDGRCIQTGASWSGGKKPITIFEKARASGNYLSATATVYGITGLVKIEG